MLLLVGVTRLLKRKVIGRGTERRGERGGETKEDRC